MKEFKVSDLRFQIVRECPTNFSLSCVTIENVAVTTHLHFTHDKLKFVGHMN
jgi:hypothetical protein